MVWSLKPREIHLQNEVNFEQNIQFSLKKNNIHRQNFDSNINTYVLASILHAVTAYTFYSRSGLYSMECIFYIESKYGHISDFNFV